jgi:hypothetical protein
MISETEVAWLAGIIDGEGCITAKMSSQSAVAFRLTIESVSDAMMGTVKHILGGLDISYVENGPIRRFNSTRPSFRIYVQRKDALLKTCDRLLPYSVVKRPEFEAVKAYLDRASGRYYSATEEDLLVLEKLRAMKRVA